MKEKDRYQTVYAKYEGSAAAPTAGLHFTPELLEKIKAKGVEIANVTLHVGIGTFRPVKEDTVEAFAEACKKAGVSQAGQLTKMMNDFIQKVEEN